MSEWLSASKKWLHRHSFLLFAIVSLGTSYAWLFAEAPQLLTPGPSSPIEIVMLFGKHWYTMLPGLPLVLYTFRVGPVPR